jgi:hypothetical protein
VATTADAKGLFPEDHEQFIGKVVSARAVPALLRLLVLAPSDMLC